MANSTYSNIISVQEALHEGTLWTITSENLPGLFLGGKNLRLLRKEVPIAIKSLYRKNYGMEVEVRPVCNTIAKEQHYCEEEHQLNEWTANPIPLAG